ncbi:glycosyltransferase family 2 protein [Paenibacillus sp. NPDC056722]|uniref:glycosyltransferase family 2 protein n=1 Tax=Paenibacillus sp. NPDC056722 TaxID=3345924 RepID=UPI00369F56A4
MVNCSIVIPNYNGRKFLEVCLRSLYEQKETSEISFEVILVDNASTDLSVDFVRAEFPEIIVIELDRNYGFSRAVNEGMYVSKGEFIILLNNDTEVDGNWLVSLYRHINQSKSAFSVSSNMIRFDERDIIDDAGDELTLFGWAFKRGDGKKVSEFQGSGHIFSSCAGAAIYRKSILNEIGLFDEDFFAYLEDVDIGYRAKLYGYHNYYCQDAIVYHIGSGTSGSQYNDFKIKLSARNNVFLFYKNMPLFQLLINLPMLLIGFLIKYVFFVTKGWGKVYLSGLYEALIHLKYVQRQKFSVRHALYYVKIQGELFASTIRYIKNKAR